MRNLRLQEMETGFRAHALCTGTCHPIRKMEISVKYPRWIWKKVLKESRCHLRAKIWQYDSGGTGRPDLILTTSGCEAAKWPTAVRWGLKVWRESKKWNDEIIERESFLAVARVGEGCGGGYKRAMWGVLVVIEMLYIFLVSVTISGFDIVIS